jgi:hypothetical protein
VQNIEIKQKVKLHHKSQIHQLAIVLKEIKKCQILKQFHTSTKLNFKLLVKFNVILYFCINYFKINLKFKSILYQY